MNLQGRDLKQDLSGDDVRLLQSELAQIGLAVSPDERQRALYGPATRDAVMQFQKQHGLPTNGVVDDRTATAINQAVAAQAADQYRVAGRIFSAQRAGVAGLRVQAVDKNVGPDVPLVQGIAGADGSYTLDYAVTPIRQRGKSAPDIQVQVYSGETLLGASDVRYNATASEALHVLLPDSASGALPAEFETLTGAIATHYRGALRDLQENGARSDVTYLANKTGWDARAVALAALADQFNQRAQNRVPAVFFYALFRAGLPANEDVLYHADAATLSAIWSRAAEQGVIPASTGRLIPEMVQQFQSLSAQKLLSSPALAGASSLTEMLDLGGLNAAQQQRFAELHAVQRTDLTAFWKAVADDFGQDTADRLQVDGKLALLTVNNAPLMRSLQQIGDPLQLVQAGYHRAEKWSGLLEQVPIPPQIPGATAPARQATYAAFLAAQLRLSYPTAAVAELVTSGVLRVEAPEQVSAFLTSNQGRFELGVQPVEQYIAQNKLDVDQQTVTQLKRLQRVYQLTPTDQAMTVLLDQNLDAAYHVVQYDRETFADTFGEQMGGAGVAQQVHDRSVRVHSAVLNVAVSYLTARNGIQLGTTPMTAMPADPAGPGNGRDGVANERQAAAAAMAVAAAPANGGGGGQIVRPAPTPPTGADAADVIAYPTLEGLFGSMDFCSCEECRSILSPAAYLVDLLLFIDKAADGLENAQAVLLDRRPDIQFLPLTCENTNTALPYIDLVNEALEYYIANAAQPLSLKDYKGHDTDGTASADLLATPQFVMNAAYTILQGEWFPVPLPFHQPLENLRRGFNKFGVPLQLAMERLRQTDDLERGANPYGWRDILMEELGLSRPEYRLLTDSTLTLNQVYGFAPAKTAAEVSDVLSNAKLYSRRVGISYDELVAVIETEFVNPNSDLIPKLQRLGVSFSDMQALHDGTLSDANFLALLPTGVLAPDPGEYNGDIVAWVKDPQVYSRIMAIITLTDPTGSTDGCNFDAFELRYSKPAANPADKSTRLDTAEFIRLLRFIRLWRKTGWTIEQTDAAICSLYKADLSPIGPGDLDSPAKLDAGFLTLLPRLGFVVRVMNALTLTPNRDLLSLLACWSDLRTHGDSALYRQLFLSPAILSGNTTFAANGYGEFLSDATKKLLDQSEALRGAFNLTGDEFDRIATGLAFDATTPLSLASISAIYRRGWLARKLHLSVRELLLLTSLTGLDPFAAPDLGAAPTPEPPISRLIALVQALRDRSVKSAVALYLIWNQDLSGKSAPDPAQVIEFARTLRGDFTGIDDQFAAIEDPGGDILRARITLVYGQDAADAFFALLDNTIVLDMPYTHPTPALEPAITAADAGLRYDDFRHRLSQNGILSTATRDALLAVPGVTGAFQAAVNGLYARGQDALGSFFARYPELQPLYTSYIASADPPDKKRTTLLAAFQPELSRMRKRQQALQRLSAASGLDLDSTRALLDPSVTPGEPYPLHADGDTAQPVLNDVLTVQTPGLAVQFFFRDTATGAPDQSVAAAGNLDYSASGGNPLPTNPIPGNAISGIWTGEIEIPDAGYYNVVVDTDAGAVVTLSLGGQAQPLTQNGTVRRNTDPLQLNAGALYDIVLTVEKTVTALSVSWETPKRPREVIPGRYLYPPSVLPPFRDAYIRFMKTASLATALRLTANEVAHFATDPDYQVDGDGWVNVLPVTGDPAGPIANALSTPFLALLEFARIKAAWSPGDERVLTMLQDPAAATANPDSLLFTLTRWDPGSLTDVLAHFAGNVAALAGFALLRRVYDAFAPVQAIGIPAAKLIQATINDPDGGTVTNFQAALRARYAAADWREIIRPINDELRALQRDALVAYILHQMRENPATAQIDTADKLFEYFLMDVEMDPCMETSRIRHALSSVQLFIERCLMNLEPRVSPKSVNAKYWVWMKRYRVWEANRKVFLFPENWLEPELRDDKSPFFKEIESELLQGDITDDSASAALLNYLAKLHDVAKLEPCGLFFEEGGAGAESDKAHVVARNSGAHRNYYYRRYETGYWTPWEQIKLDIEDNPVIPVVWNGRLLLLWLRILKQTPQSPPAPSGDGTKLTEQTLSKITTDAKSNADQNVKVTIRAVLCWSEYYNGKWQATRTSDINQPVDLGQFVPSGPSAFNRSAVQLSSDEVPDSAGLDGTFLRITISGGIARRAFLLYNTHSLPLPTTPPSLLPFGETRWFETSNATFTVDYDDRTPDIPDNPLSRDVLTDSIPYGTIQPNNHLPDIWDAPFFFEDRRNVFYVTSEEKPTWVRDLWGYGVGFNPGVVKVPQVPPLVVQPYPQPAPPPWGDGSPIGPDPGVVDPAPMQRFITEDAYIRQGLALTTTVAYGDHQIGPAGAVALPAANLNGA